MRLTAMDLETTPGLRVTLNEWCAKVNIALKKDEAPTFRLDGPRVLKARQRFAGALSDFAFIGDEELRPSALFMDQDTLTKVVNIWMLFTPVSFADIAKFSTVSIPFQQATEILAGFNEWIVETTGKPDVPTPERLDAAEREAAAVAALPSVTETRANPKWGAW